MNYVKFLMQFLALLPGITGDILQLHAAKTITEKLAIGATMLAPATALSVSLLPPEDVQMAQVAGGAAQSILATTIQAIHDAQNPAPSLG